MLSLVGSLLILYYLHSTHSKAPRFSSSIRGISNAETPFVTIIVTARNEEEKIGACLSSLTKQEYANFEVVVVDDSSIDRTRDIALEVAARDNRIRVFSAGPKPQGWVGKSFACFRGYESSRGEILLFVDADSTFHRSVVLDSVNYLLAKNYDILSISPRVNLKGILAMSTLPLVSCAIDLLYPLTKVNDEKSERAYVFGTFILVKKKVYEAIGGHRAVRDLIVEDAAIAQRAKSSGFKLRVELGPEFLSTDWEHEPRKIYSGLERVTSTSIRKYGLASILNAVLLFFLAIYPILFAVFVVLTSLDNSVLIVGFFASLLNISIFLAIFASETRLVAGKVGFIPLLYPLGVLIFISAIVTTSVKVSRGRGIEWKGDSYTQSIASKQQS